MLERTFELQAALHARPAAALIKLARENRVILFVKEVRSGEWEEAGIMNLLLAGANGKGRLTLGLESSPDLFDGMAEILKNGAQP
jgi:phosphotransferase system HPr-like phosphotransfer protein